MQTGETEAWLVFNSSGLTGLRQRMLIEAFGGPEQVLAASDSDLVQVEGIDSLHVRKLREAAARGDGPRLRQRLEEKGWRLVPITRPEYPPRLLEIQDPPPLLFVEGEITPADQLAVAVVGTRKCTPYARQMARRIGHDLAARGATVVSGLALGADGEAHEGALEAGGRTIAVLGCGLEVVYPTQHADLRTRIATSGAVVSEFPLDAPPSRESFPHRNRIISGLSLAVLVIEAPTNSGALITARLAGEQGREVFALPGDVTRPESRGSNELIRDGAMLVQSADDVLEGLGVGLEEVATTAPRAATTGLPPEEAAVYGALEGEGGTVDDLVASTGLDAARVMAVLMLLEVKGLVRRFGGGNYGRVD